MRALVNTLYFISYAAIAVAAALWLPGALAIGELSAVLIAMIFLALAVHLHLLLIRRMDRADIEGDIRDIRDGQTRSRDEIEDLAETVEAQKKLVVREIDRNNEALIEHFRHALAGDRSTALLSGPGRAGNAGEKIEFDGLDARAPDNGRKISRPERRDCNGAVDGRNRGPAKIEDIVTHAVGNEEVDLYLQPIVRIPDRSVQFYEAFARLRDDQGNIFLPSQFDHAASQLGLSGAIDNLVLSHCVRISRRLEHQRPGLKIFYNVNPVSIADDQFLDQFVDFMLENAGLASRLVFEFHLDDVRRRPASRQKRIDELGEAGYQFSIDHVGDFDIDPAFLTVRHIRYFKIPAPFLRGDAAQQPKFLEDLRARGIAVTVENIDDDKSLMKAMAAHADYGQGRLFGRPRISRDTAYHLESAADQRWRT